MKKRLPPTLPERPAVTHGFPPWFVDALLEEFAVDEAELRPTTKLCDDLGADSLDVVELAMVFERDQHIDLSDAVLDRWPTATLTQILADVRRAGAKP